MAVNSETILNSNNVDELLRKRALTKGVAEQDIVGFNNELKKRLIDNYGKIVLHPGNNYFIAIDVDECLKRGMNNLVETTYHEPTVHANKSQTSSNEAHKAFSGNRYGNYARQFSYRKAGTPLDTFLKQLDLVNTIHNPLAPAIIDFVPNSNQVKYISKSPRTF